jgi:hypothetical protein
MKRDGNNLNVVLPDSFTAKQVELIILPFEENEPMNIELTIADFRKKAQIIFENYHGDISGFIFNRDELNDRQ